MPERKRLGDLLVETNIITQEQLVETLQRKSSQERLGDALVKRGFLTDQQLIEVLEYQLGIAHVSLTMYPIDETLLSLVGKEYSIRNYALPILKRDDTLTVAMADPLDYMTIDDIELRTGFKVVPVISSKNDILDSIEKFTKTSESILYETAGEAAYDNSEEAPAIKLSNQLFSQGIALGASDIHIDPHEDQLIVRYRVDGVLKRDRVLGREAFASLVARLKIMANLNITESRLPQDGKIRLTMGNQTYDLRLSILPTINGEKVVIRILDPAKGLKTLNNLDLNKRYLQSFIQLIEQPSGLVLLTGPTGSGKTTTLYSALQHLNSEGTNIVTIEDPVEYQIEGINQVQVNPSIQLTFAAGLRAILRQDPNIIMVGEIRDEETAEIAVRSALTGHFVLSTLHTNDAISTVPRLLDMNVEPYMVISALSGVVSQRLVRKICVHCVETREPNEMEKKIFERRMIDLSTISFGKGCDKCRGTGFKGRIGIHEIFVVEDTIRSMLFNQASMQDVKKEAMKQGMIPLIDDGLLKVKAGITTLEEVLKVTNE
ncbi:GspE/PulE family protein [Paenisporosarcina cavernae]|uniref:Type II/IV secretion system protein n=1 Tax=Paenisporosarcina cavernae TaxID=2320858 RepID=A0A385YSW2_9BACL|nr:GspE/PulE family protein [Paenisporosarcina cavernae]AYC29756.1 type II/IV secretion system protein [Paenisporosarcina cavernae]